MKRPICVTIRKMSLTILTQSHIYIVSEMSKRSKNSMSKLKWNFISSV